VEENSQGKKEGGREYPITNSQHSISKGRGTLASWKRALPRKAGLAELAGEEEENVQ